jgi:hypothetical protein
VPSPSRGYGAFDQPVRMFLLELRGVRSLPRFAPVLPVIVVGGRVRKHVAEISFRDMNPIAVSTTLPDTPPGFVPRENVNMTIDTMLQGEAHAVVLQGRDGVGKTTILNSYVRSRSSSSICLFLKPLRLSYEPSGVIPELYAQVRESAGMTATEVIPSRSDLANVVQKLSSRLLATNKTMTVVVDGLGDVYARERTAAQDVLDLLPLGRRSFRFLFSGELGELLQAAGCQWRSYPVTLFSIDETKQLFAGLSVEDPELARAHLACNGVVGQLAAVRRLYQSGLPIGEIIEKQPGELSNTMLLEWQRAPLLTEQNKDVLAILTFDSRRHSFQSLALVSDRGIGEVTEAIKEATFLVEESDGILDFVSLNFRTFAERRLAHQKQATLESLIVAMRQDSAEPTVVTTLPQLMSDAKQHRELVGLLDGDYFRTVGQVAESIAAIKAQARLGARSAEFLNDDPSIFRYRLIQSLAADSTTAEGRQAEITALVAVGEVRQALALARTPSFREERLRLLASALAGCIERGLEVESALRDELRQLCLSSALDALSDDIVEIAGDVFVVDPETALQLIERFGKHSKKAHASDWVIAAFSMRHALKGRKPHSADTNFEQLRERIADPRVRSVFEVTVMGRAQAEEWILQRSANISDASDRLAVLRMWLGFNNRRPNAARVASAALELAVQTREYSLTVPVLRQFAAPLPYSEDKDAAARLIGQIDALIGVAPHRSPSVEYVRLQILLARTQEKLQLDGARLRLVDLYLFISLLKDPAIKAECLARLYAWLPRIEPDRNHDDIRAELMAIVDEVLQHAAYHDDVMLPLLRALVTNHSKLAFDLVGKLNTDLRRDYVRGQLIEEYARATSSKDIDKHLDHEIRSIVDPRVSVQAVIAALRQAALRKNESLARVLWPHVANIRSPEDRATASIFFSRATFESSKAEETLLALTNAIQEVRNVERREAVGFAAVHELAAVDESLARRLMAWVKSDRAASGMKSSSTGLLLCVRLAARAVRGVVRAGRDATAELDLLVDSCHAIPNAVSRVTVLGEVCYWLRREGRIDLAGRFHERIWATLQEAKDESDRRFIDCMVIAGWSLFENHAQAFVKALGGLNERDRERIVGSVVRTLTEGVPPTEPCDPPTDMARDLSHKTCTDIVGLLDQVCDDELIFRSVRAISRSSTKRNGRMTREQKADLQADLLALVNRKLPCASKIRHQGYKWASVAELLRMSDSKEDEWRELAGYAAGIPNVPDAAYTMSIVSAAIPPKFQDARHQAISKAIELARSVTVGSERDECLANLANEIRRFDEQSAKDLLRECAKAVAGSEGKLDDKVDRLLDIAYRISAEFALALSTELDNDSARMSARSERIKARKEMLENDGQGSALGDSEGDVIADAAWNNLGALNGGLIAPRTTRTLRSHLERGANWPLFTSYPVFAWTVQNWVSRSGNAQDAQILRSVAQSALLVGQLMKQLTLKTKPNLAAEPADDQATGVEFVGPGERMKAVDAIRAWLATADLSYLKIADQFFGPNELEFLKLVLEANPLCHVHVLTSQKHLQQLGHQGEWERVYREAWARISFEATPPTDITVIGVPPHGKSPIHDRWWVAKGSALDFGTSSNSLGLTQLSTIKSCDAQVAKQMESQLAPYLDRTIRWVDAGRISYLTIGL